MIRLIFFAIAISSHLHAVGVNGPIVLSVPNLSAPSDISEAHLEFRKKLSDPVNKINKGLKSKITIIAPLGGSKVLGLSELRGDGLVILSMERPGSPIEVVRAFTDGRSDLSSSVQASLNLGSMSTNDVRNSSVTAQILCLLHLQFGIEDVEVSWLLPSPRVPTVTSDQLLKMWDGDPVGVGDVPLVVRFRFRHDGRVKEIIYVAWMVSSDRVTNRSSLPVSMLWQLRPQGYEWGYLSADGMMFFSGDENNGSANANQELVELIRPEGGMLLDYPRTPYYHTPQFWGEITFFAGRSNIESWGFGLSRALPLVKPVFGYSGIYEGDEVRVYQKNSQELNIDPNDRGQIFDLKSFTSIGGPIWYRLK